MLLTVADGAPLVGALLGLSDVAVSVGLSDGVGLSVELVSDEGDELADEPSAGLIELVVVGLGSSVLPEVLLSVGDVTEDWLGSSVKGHADTGSSASIRVGGAAPSVA